MFDGTQGTLADLISQLETPELEEATDGMGAPMTPGFGGVPMTPGMQAPMTPADINRSLEVKKVLNLALKRIGQEFASTKAKDVEKETRIKTLTDRITLTFKAIHERQAQMHGAIITSQTGTKKTEYIVSELLRRPEGTTSQNQLQPLMEEVKKVHAAMESKLRQTATVVKRDVDQIAREVQDVSQGCEPFMNQVTSQLDQQTSGESTTEITLSESHEIGPSRDSKYESFI